MSHKKLPIKFLPILPLLVLIGSIFLPLLRPAKAFAAPSGGTWVNRIYIKVPNDSGGTDNFTDSNIWDNTHVYTGAALNGCTSEIDTGNPDGGPITKATYIQRLPSALTSCVETKNTSFSLANPEEQLVSAYRVADNAIWFPQSFALELNAGTNLGIIDYKNGGPKFFRQPLASDNDPGYNSLSDKEKTYYRKVNSDGSYTSYDYLTLTTDAKGVTHVKTGGDVPIPDLGPALAGISIDLTQAREQNFVLKNGGDVVPLPAEAGDVPPGIHPVTKGGDSASGGNGAAASATPDIQCETSLSNPLTWLMCPLILAANSAVSVLDTAITHELNIDTNEYLCTGTQCPNGNGNAFYQAWSSFRYIALTLLVVIALVMILSEALSLDIFDAYTIRKVLPRLLLAVIFITLSWSLTSFAINIANHLGQGIRAVIYSPFAGMDDPRVGGAGSSIAVGGLAIGVTTLGILGSLSFGLTALLAVFVAFGVLVLRKMLVLLLVVTAPVAIVAYILPNTQRVWKMWSDYFLRALMVFPIVAAFIAMGRVFAKVAYTSDKGLLGQFVAFVAYFLPYFMLPTAFRLAGGAIAGISAAASSRTKGASDRLKGYRGKKAQDNIAAMKSGDRFQGKNALARSFNKRSAGAASGFKGGFGFGKRGEAYHDLHGRAAAEDAIRNNHNLQQLGYDDPGIAVLALSGNSRKGAERVARQLQAANGWTDDQRDRAVASAAAVGFTNSNVAGAMTLLSQNKARALTGSLAGEAGMDLVRQSAMQMSGGNEQMVENLMGGFAFNSRNAGRMDFGGESAGESLLAGWQRGTVQQHAQSFGASMKAFADVATPTLKNGSVSDRQAAAVTLMEMQSMLPGSSAENQDIINGALAAAGVDHNLQRTEAVMQPDGSMRNMPVHVSVEEQLAALSGGAITASMIRGKARVYDQSVPIPSQAQNLNQPPPTPGATP